MKQHLVYFYLQLKLLLQHFPKMIAGTIVLAILVSTITFCGSKLLYQNSAVDKTAIALVVEDDTPLMKLGLDFLQSSESINTFCELYMVSEAEAKQMLEEKRVAASIYFPKTFTEDIKSGENTPLVVTFSGSTGIEPLLFQELADAATHILSCAQASIYTIHDLYNDYSFYGRKGRHYDYVNQNTLQAAFIRAQLFETEEVSATNELSTEQYYIVTGIILLVFLGGISCGTMVVPEQGALAEKLKQHRLYAPWRLVWKCLALTLFFLLLYGLLAIVAVRINVLPHDVCKYLPILALISSSWTLLMYTLGKNHLGGTILIFFATLVSTIFSGGLVPSSFLPRKMAAFGAYLPTGYAHRLLGDVLSSSDSFADVVPLLLCCVLFLLIAVVLLAYAERRRTA